MKIGFNWFVAKLELFFDVFARACVVVIMATYCGTLSIVYDITGRECAHHKVHKEGGCGHYTLKVFWRYHFWEAWTRSLVRREKCGFLANERGDGCFTPGKGPPGYWPRHDQA